MNVVFLQPADYLTFISESALRKVCRENDGKLREVENLAYGYIFEKLSVRYEISKEIICTGENRNPALLRWMIILSVYYLYQSVADDDIPERVRINYEDVIKEIDRVSSGRDNSTLTKVVDRQGKAKTTFRWASNPRRTHNPFS